MLQTPYTALEAPPWRVSAPDAIGLGLRNLNLERGSCTPSCIRGSGAPETPDTQLRHLHLWVDGRLFSRVFGGSFGGCLAGYLTSQRWPCSVGSSSLQPQSITLTSAFQGNLMILDWTHTHTHTHTHTSEWLIVSKNIPCLSLLLLHLVFWGAFSCFWREWLRIVQLCLCSNKQSVLSFGQIH